MAQAWGWTAISALSLECPSCTLSCPRSPLHSTWWVATPAVLRLGPWSLREGSGLHWELSAAVTACPLAQVLYSPWALPPRRPAGMSLPFSSHIWVLDTRVPSFSWFSTWFPALTKEGEGWPWPR